MTDHSEPQPAEQTTELAGFDQGTWETILERIGDGESLRAICATAGFPTKAKVFRWLAASPLLSDQYARAREAQADSYFDDVADISDRTDLEANDKRVRIDARKWMAGKLRPKKYGDKFAVVGGDAGDNPIRMDVTRLTDEQLAALEGILGAAAQPGSDQGGEGPTGG